MAKKNKDKYIARYTDSKNGKATLKGPSIKFLKDELKKLDIIGTAFIREIGKPNSKPIKYTPRKPKAEKPKQKADLNPKPPGFFKGNQLWRLRNSHGRNRLWEDPEELWASARDYFQFCEENPWYKIDYKGGGLHSGPKQVKIPTERPYTKSGLCIFLGCSQSYFREFKSAIKKKDPQAVTEIDRGFLTVIHAIDEIITNQQLEGATVGAYNANIIARLQGLMDKQQITHDGELNVSQTTVFSIKPKVPDNE